MKRLGSLIALILIFSNINAQWNNATAVNNLVVAGPQYDDNWAIVPDGKDGGIMAFISGELFQLSDKIMVKRIKKDGTVVWGNTNAGNTICNASAIKYGVVAEADGNGGAFIAWVDDRNASTYNDIFIQHIDSMGNSLWAANGIAVTNTPLVNDHKVFLTADGSGGVMVGWNWNNLTSNQQASIQHYDAEGHALLPEIGVQIITNAGFRILSDMVTDGSGGVIAFLMDTRNDPFGTNYTHLENNGLKNGDIYAQRILSNGSQPWGAAGLALCANTKHQETGVAIADGAGGAIFFIEDYRNDVVDINGYPNYDNPDIYAQRVNANGIMQWEANGVAVCTTDGFQYPVNAIANSSSNFTVSWDAIFTDNVIKAYSQMVNGSGTIQWTSAGILMTGASLYTYSHDLSADAGGNTLCTFVFDANTGSAPTVNGQKLNSSGALQWGVQGAIIANNNLSNPAVPKLLQSDNASFIAIWNDYRNSATTLEDVYASKITSTGTLAGSAGGTVISIANGNWNATGTWLGGVLPTSTSDVIIRHHVTVNTSSSCKKLTVENNGGNVSVAAGISLTVLQ